MDRTYLVTCNVVSHMNSKIKALRPSLHSWTRRALVGYSRVRKCRHPGSVLSRNILDCTKIPRNVEIQEDKHASKWELDKIIVMRTMMTTNKAKRESYVRAARWWGELWGNGYTALFQAQSPGLPTFDLWMIRSAKQERAQPQWSRCKSAKNTTCRGFYLYPPQNIRWMASSIHFWCSCDQSMEKCGLPKVCELHGLKYSNAQGSIALASLYLCLWEFDMLDQ